jgi:dephospho-CoA kinase
MTAVQRLRIGLTGGIGSGKSTAAELFAAQGAAVVDADAIAHELTAAGGAAMPALVAAFGPQICTAQGALDRAAMRARVFGNPQERLRLESILHPLIQNAMQVQAARAAGEYVVLVVPLLIEHLQRWRQQVDRVCVVDCPESLQIARVAARSGLPHETIAAIMAAQATRAQRLAAADDVIDNATTRQALAAQVRALHAKYAALTHEN